MAWIPVDQSLRDHRKVLVLAGELDVDQATAVGHLVLFWLWCMDNAPTGILKRINGLQIATAAAWPRNPNDFVNALLSAGFLEKCGRGAISLRIHDWGQYGGRLCVARDKHRESMRQARASLDQSRSDQSREEKTRVPPLSPPKGGRRRRRRDDTGPLSGRHHDKVQH